MAVGQKSVYVHVGWVATDVAKIERCMLCTNNSETDLMFKYNVDTLLEQQNLTSDDF